MGLYCKNEGKRNLIQSIFTLGAFIGLIMINLISDTKGRKLSMGISVVSINLGNLGIFLI
jgi:MFS family permease